jgi:hypothetical protein
VISDIDDTVKITGIPDGESIVLRNTFFRSYRAAPCMAELYRSFGEDAAFHYVSGAPWQLYLPTADFLFSQAVGFPRGSFHMKNLRTNPFEKESYQDIWNILSSGPEQATFAQKIAQMTAIFEHFPGRRFILIGDSGEKDPEVFAQIRAAFPAQVAEIFIRRVTDEEESDPGRLSGMTTIPPAADGEGSCTELLKALPRSRAEGYPLPRGSRAAPNASHARPGGKGRAAGATGQTRTIPGEKRPSSTAPCLRKRVRPDSLGLLEHRFGGSAGARRHPRFLLRKRPRQAQRLRVAHAGRPILPLGGEQ